MAAPETQFQQAGLNIPYNYSPVETRLNPPIQLPGTGELWAKVGETAMNASKMLQNTAGINPEIRAQMKYAIDNFNYGQEHLKYLRSKGDYGQMVTGTTPEGPTTIPGGTTGIDSMIKMGLLGQGTGGKGGGGGDQGKGHDPGEGEKSSTESPTTPTSRTDIQTDAEGVQWFYNPSTSNWERLQTSPGQPTTKPSAPTTKPAVRPHDRPKDPSDLLTLNTQVPSQGGSTAALTAGPGGVLNTGQPQSSDVQAQPAAAYRAQYAAQHPQGAPAGMFLNPATGSYEPLQGPVPPPTTPSPGMFAPSAATAPPPAAPTTAQPETNQPGNMLLQGSQPPSRTAGAIQQVTQQPGVALADWQAQNAHPVMASNDALNWAKNFDTGAQRATYLPHGGPGGEPAYAFHMKGGGVNTVPISQIVKNGGGPAVAGQNTSATLSASDALSNPPQGQPEQQPIAAQPAVPQQGGQVWNPQQPAPIQPGPPPAAPSAYNPAAYQMPQGPTITQAGEVNPALMAGGTDEQAAAAAKAAAQPPVPNVGQELALNHLTAHSPEELSKMDSDPDAGSFAGFDWHQDRHDGRFYTTMKSPSSTLNEQRNYWGGPGWQDMPMENSGLRQALRDAIKTTRGITFSDAETRDMPIDDVKFWLEEAKYLDKTGGDPSGTTALHIKGTTQQAQSITRMIDALEAAKQAGIDPAEYSGGAEDLSKQAGEAGAHKLPPGELFYPQVPGQRGLFGVPYINPGAAWHALLENWHRSQAGATGQIHPLADALTREALYFAAQMGETPGITYTAEGKPENRGTTFSVAGIPIHLPAGSDISPLQQINRIFQSQPPDEVIRDLKDVRQKLYDDITSSTDLATRLNFRTPPSFKAVQTAINSGQDIPDKTNKFKAGLPDYLRPKPVPTPTPTPTPTGNARQDLRQVGGLPRGGATAQPTPTPGPTPMAQVSNPAELAAFKRKYPAGTHYMAPDANGRMIEWVAQ